MVVLTEQATRRTINIWMIKEETPAALVADRVTNAPAEKVRQRHSGYGIPGMFENRTYTIPKENVQQTSINGRLAAIALGTYQGIPPERFEGRAFRPFSRVPTEPMNEFMIWIYTQQTRVFFFTRVRVDDLPQMRPHVEQLAYSAIVP
jgi:hypothetical protein